MFTLVYYRENNVPYVAPYECDVDANTVREAIDLVKIYHGFSDSYVGTLWHNSVKIATFRGDGGIVNVTKCVDDPASVLLDNVAGCTVTRNGRITNAKRGYWVGGRLTCQFSVNQPRERVEPIIAAWIEALPDNARNVGIWTSDGKIYVDVSDLFSNRENAIDAALNRGELAIWDIANGCEIRV